MVGTSLLLEACSDDGYDSDPLEIDLTEAPFNALSEPNTWVLHPTEKIILVNDDGTLRAFSSICTHQSCSDFWVFGQSEATCTCHGSKFGRSGQVLNGPAKKDLKQLEVYSQSNSITVYQKRNS